MKLPTMTPELIWAMSFIGFVYMTGMTLTAVIILGALFL